MRSSCLNTALNSVNKQPENRMESIILHLGKCLLSEHSSHTAKYSTKKGGREETHSFLKVGCEHKFHRKSEFQTIPLWKQVAFFYQAAFPKKGLKMLRGLEELKRGEGTPQMCKTL